tara:strand:- start:80 stop:343 length:264 start_codon:yes stop_codon:yes gene_type:complete
MLKIDELLDEREKTHGDFTLNAHVGQELRTVFRRHSGNHSEVVRECLEHIATKLARICTGDALEPDHWRDLQGYAGLALKDCHDHKS